MDNQEIGTYKEWKFGIVTRTVYRIGEEVFEINDMSDGWKTCIVNKCTINELLNGTKCITNLKFT